MFIYTKKGDAVIDTSTLANVLSENNRKDIKARDRVDISLEEYERLKDENRRLSTEVVRLKMLLGEFGIPTEMISKIRPGTTTLQCCSSYKDFVTRVRIEFDVDDI